MGCPAKKVVKSEHGIALRRNHDLAFRLIEAVAKATNLPVSVKTRLGWSDASDLISFGLGAQNSGADMLCIHARTYQEPYGVPAVWGPLYELKKALTIPVLGNGGVTKREDGMALCQNLDGFLIGQAAIGNPWVFLPEKEQPLVFSEKLEVIRLHAAWMIEERGELNGMRQFRKHFLQYVKGIPNAKSFRSAICHVASLADVDAALALLAPTG
jgi:tRNA-dihydrouridine synthase